MFRPLSGSSPAPPPLRLGTAFVSSTVPYGNQVTSASTRAAADYVTNQQKGLEVCAAPASAGKDGSAWLPAASRRRNCKLAFL